jgi:hypothetical protein
MMRASNAVMLVAAIGLLPTDGVVAAEAGDSALVMTIADDTIELTVPVSALSLRIPKGDLSSVEESKTGAQDSSRYFHLSDTRRGLAVSGWFEPAHTFKGHKEFWAGEFSAMKRAGLFPTAPPTGVAVASWMGLAYEFPLPKDAGEGINTHIRVELIEAGTWIDLHISITARKPVADVRNEALEFLKSIVVNKKN